MQAERKTEKQSKTQETAYWMKISICTKLKNDLHLFEHSFISNTFAPGAWTILFSLIKVDHFCERSDMLDSKSAGEHFMIVIRHDVLVTNQLTMCRLWQVHFFVGAGPLLAIIFPFQKGFNALIKELFKHTHAATCATIMTHKQKWVFSLAKPG